MFFGGEAGILVVFVVVVVVVVVVVGLGLNGDDCACFGVFVCSFLMTVISTLPSTHAFTPDFKASRAWPFVRCTIEEGPT